jgi:BolA protein
MPEAVAIRIEERLRAALDPIALAVRDDSAAHVGHAGAASGGGHYHVHVVSARFAGLARVARHRLVYDVLGDLMLKDIHALALTLAAPNE